MARSSCFGPEILGFCISEAVESPGIVHVLKLWANLHRFEGLGHWSLRAYGGAWWCMVAPLLMIFLGFARRRPLDRVVASVLQKLSQICANIKD